MKAGAAVVDITPRPGTWMAGFAARTQPAAGVHDPLSVRAIAVSDGSQSSLVVVADLLALDVDMAAQVAELVSARTGVPGSAVAVCVTHTHGGPAVGPAGLGGPVDHGYVDLLLDRLADVASQAWERLRPARLRRGRAELHGVAHNRRGGGVIDPAVLALRWDDQEGRPIATVFSHACHPVSLGPDNLLFTADWPGAARTVVERTYGGVAVFLQGCCGQINTGHQAADSYRTFSGAGRTFERANELGTLVGRAVISALDSAPQAPSGGVQVSTRRVELTLGPVPDDETLRGWAEEWSMRARTADAGKRAVLATWTRWANGWIGREPRIGVPVPVAVHRWAGASLVFLPGEPFVAFALALRAELDDPMVLAIGYAGGVPGYIPYPPEEYDLGGYEVLEAHRAYGQLAPFAQDAGPRLLQVAIVTAGQAAPSGTTHRVEGEADVNRSR